MNQPSGLRERKQSLNRLSVNTNSKQNFSNELKRKGNSLSKKTPEIEDICQLDQPNTNCKYLVGWGRLPFLHQQQTSLQIINKDIREFDSGEEHLVFINHKNEAYAMGNSHFGQLGIRQNNKNRDVIAPVFEQFKIKRVFCTQFTTFLLTNSNDLYACGLNNRGQLGLALAGEQVSSPQLIEKLSEYKENDSLKRKNSRSRITSVYYQEMRKESVQLEGSDEPDTNRHQSCLDVRQNIADLRGGPFHTVVLTSKGRLFYSGNLYKSSSISDDQYTNEFIELNTSRLGKIVSIRASLTGIGFMTQEGRVYLLGYFGEHIFNQPELVENQAFTSFDINDQGIYATDPSGGILFYNIEKHPLQQEKLTIGQKIKDIICGVDFVLALTRQGTVFGRGDNTQHQISTSSTTSYSSFQPLQFTFKDEQKLLLRCNNNFVLTLVSKPPPLEISKVSNSEMAKYRDLQRQNKILKQLLCNKNKKSVKIQTERESKFDMIQPLNARTFDNSMEIPFDEIKLGKQISEGGYGIIFKATWRKSTVAVKVFKIEPDNENAIRDFISQCHAMEALRHPNIVMFLGACTKPPHFAIVLEYCEGGTVWSLLQKQSLEIGWDQRRQLALDTARGMNYLHERNTPVLHRDLKSLNLLLDNNKRVKLADFGWTKGLQNYMTGKIGTYQWMAPEVISAYQYTEKADVFSFGIILWEIAARQAPYRNIPGPQVAQDVLTKDLRPIIPKKTPQNFSSLIRRCWDKSPSVRPSFSDIITELQEMRFS